MSVEFIPAVQATLGDMIASYGFQISPLVFWHTSAQQWADSSGTGVSQGRYHAPTSEIEGASQPKPQDTTLFTGKNTGRVFDLVTGICKDDWVEVGTATNPATPNYGLLFPDSTVNAEWQVRDRVVNHGAGSNSGMRHAYIVLTIFPPATGCVPTAANCYITFGFNFTDAVAQYQLVFEYGMPPRLEYKSVQTKNIWVPVASLQDYGAIDELRYMQERFVIKIKPNQSRGLLGIEIGNGGYLRQSPDRPLTPDNPGAVAGLPQTEQYDIHGKNRAAAITIYPMRYKALTVTQSPKQFSVNNPNFSQAVPVHNLTGGEENGQTNSAALAQDSDGNMSFSLTASQPDDGSGYGSIDPPRSSDLLWVIPPNYTFIFGGGNFGTMQTITVHEHQVWDDARRQGWTEGQLYFLNHRGQWSGLAQHLSLNLLATNGYTWAQRCQGIIGIDDGWNFTIAGGAKFGHAKFTDRSFQFRRPIGQEIIMDGLSIYQAVRILVAAAGVHEMFIWPTLPDPGWPPYANNAVVYTLPKGTGLNPKYRFTPEMTVEQCLQAITQDSGTVDPLLARTTPFYYWFDALGFFHFEAYNPGFLGISWNYSTGTTDPFNSIFGAFHYSNSIENLRTAVTLQGQDALTFELLQAHQEMPWNYNAVGFPWPAFERNERQGSQMQMNNTMRTLGIQASLGTQFVRFTAPFHPPVFAGQVITCDGFLYNILEIDSHYGMAGVEGGGEMACFSSITARSLINSLVL